MEYIGTFLGRIPHGSAKQEHALEYIKTKPNVQRELKEHLKSESVKTVEHAMDKRANHDISKQRTEKQLRNIKYVQNKKSDSLPGNVADQIICAEEMVIQCETH